MLQEAAQLLEASLKSLDEELGRGRGSLRSADMSMAASIKEIIALARSLVEKSSCLSSSRISGSQGYICDGRWSLVVDERLGISSISKVGRSIGISFRGGEIVIASEKGGLAVGRSYVRAFIGDLVFEAGYRDLAALARSAHIVRKASSTVIEILKKADESFTRCIRASRLKC